ncbi:hypothetical protein [Streptomyces griseoaurantiacus]|uniref:Uncharacterized protein n=1 Tax=Streptomyces griseoaurantiacus TaxID=68213 RepID=A0A7W2HY72_9ACTN|nr:hypothetical protein [Streptomyces griseoaurantiacus]MBA5226030.1 hypothetical protein [Streptomyces griseoaurantiacus]
MSGAAGREVGVYVVATHHYSGDDWEKHCLLLARRHYGADQVQEIPARHGGDLGIEAFTFCGRAFQCYAPVEPLSTAERYEKQRDKLSTDLRKLITKQKELHKLLGDVKIHNYIFLVPIFDSAHLVQHASTKAEELREKNLPFISGDFKITVATDAIYAAELSEVLERPISLIDVLPTPPNEVDDWMQGNSELAQMALIKLAKLRLSPAAQKSYLEQLVNQFLDSENALTRLREKYPDQWEAATGARVRKERKLVLEYPPGSTHSAADVTSIARSLKEDLSRQAPALDDAFVDAMSWGSIADWLMRCPLDFEIESAS